MDGLQVGARNFQNFSLLKKIGQVTAEYASRWCCTSAVSRAPLPSGSPPPTTSPTEGNDNVVLCERGIRTFETATRFTLDIAAVPVIHKQSLYPVCIDVSHPAGQRDLVPSLGVCRRGRRSRLAHDRGAPQPARGPVRRPPAADAGPVPRAYRRSCASWRLAWARRSSKTLRPPSGMEAAALPSGGRPLCA